MLTWITIVLGYALCLGLVHLLGGLASAGHAFERWGRAVGNATPASLSSGR